MGKPVVWNYQMTLSPAGDSMRVSLHRVQEGTDTRFLWLESKLGERLEVSEADAVLQAFYTAVLALMEASC